MKILEKEIVKELVQNKNSYKEILEVVDTINGDDEGFPIDKNRIIYFANKVRSFKKEEIKRIKDLVSAEVLRRLEKVRDENTISLEVKMPNKFSRFLSWINSFTSVICYCKAPFYRVRYSKVFYPSKDSQLQIKEKRTLCLYCAKCGNVTNL